MMLTIIILFGFLFDNLFGDPLWLWHPVRAIGRLISHTEKCLRRIFPSTPKGEFLAGIFLWLITCGISFAVPFALLYAAEKINIRLRFFMETLMCYQIFACKSLADAGKHIRSALSVSLDEGRKAVSWYVGRDTAELSREGVIKAAIETVAENLTDGIIAPLFFLLLGGAPLGFFYKAVNTLDSMVGYRNERFEYLGKCSLRYLRIYSRSSSRRLYVAVGGYPEIAFYRRLAYFSPRPYAYQKSERRTNGIRLRGRSRRSTGRRRQLFRRYRKKTCVGRRYTKS